MLRSQRSEDGSWSIVAENSDDNENLEKWNPVYRSSLPKYLTALDPAFTKAKQTNEFEFILSLLRVRGLQDAGWDPYETTLRAIPAMGEVHRALHDFEAARHLELWTYGHILEASEPYELLANMVDVASGGHFQFERFPSRNGRPQSPGEKINQLEQAASRISMPSVVIPLKESWDRDLRNSIFHADYVLFGSNVRIFKPSYRTYSGEEIMMRLNRALAYHDALAGIYNVHIGNYKEPQVVPIPATSDADPEARAMVIVRESYGVTGIKDAWSHEQLMAGKIPFRLGRFTQDELNLLNADRTLAILPARADQGRGASPEASATLGIGLLILRMKDKYEQLRKGIKKLTGKTSEIRSFL